MSDKQQEAFQHLCNLITCLSGGMGDVSVAIKPKALPLKEAAKYIAVSRSRIYELERENKLHRIKNSSPVAYRISVLDKYLDDLEKG
jgi:predicted DNA-binding transcriptional regulator AlpA